MSATLSLPNPWYYLDNFTYVIDWVDQRYEDALTPLEIGHIARLRRLPRHSLALLTRMIMRRGDLFRSGALHYEEIGDTLAAAAPLLEERFIEVPSTLALPEWFGLLTRREIAQVFDRELQATRKGSARKFEQLEALSACLETPDALPTSYVLPHETIYRLGHTLFYDRVRLMFFGNLHQDWTEFVLSDLGLQQYEKVAFPAQARAFTNRSEVDDYMHLHALRAELDLSESVDELLQLLSAIPAAPHATHWLEARRSKLLFKVGHRLERSGHYDHALHCYGRSAHHEARIRSMRILERTSQNDKAMKTAQDILQRPRNDGEVQAALRALTRLKRKGGVPDGAVVLGRSKRTARIHIALPSVPGLRVEEEVRQHLHDTDAPVYYVENALINSLFGLLCWDIIFAAVPGAFFHPFQDGPVDLLEADFFQRRQGQFNERFRQFDTNDYRRTIVAVYNEKRGLRSSFVWWGVMTPALLDHALQCIPAEHLKCMFRRLVLDIRHNRSGLPDLIQLWPNERRYQLIEVKGPGDRLQDNQLRWLDFCASHEIPALVCHVQRPTPLDARAPACEFAYKDHVARTP